MREQSIEFHAGDGCICNLIHVLGHQEPTRWPVILVHGAGVRANIFPSPNTRCTSWAVTAIWMCLSARTRIWTPSPC